MIFWRSAWVWGKSVKHQPQKVGKEHVLCDEDVVQIVKRSVIADVVVFSVNRVWYLGLMCSFALFFRN